ncbi:MAG TPA: F0F1 ATP synthase subunit B [Chitinophagales bacterium]|nr:F0F1 ATP synthase subunit B [Chitinophagales bacterium]HPH88556.1 F0F1 ATP synthase subunit B [Chitinophagales bacterium]
MHILAFDPMSLILPDLGLLFWMTLIFLLFWFLMGKFAFKPIVKAIKDREQSIDDALSAADKAKNEMQQLQSDNAALLKEAREESAKILKEAKEIKESVIAEAHSKAKDEAAKIVASAKVEIDAQKKAALAEVKNEVSKLSLEIAQKVLGRELDATKDQQSYINSLVDKMN